MSEPSPTNPQLQRPRSPRRALRPSATPDPAPMHHPDVPVIPDKLRFRIGEVARLCGVQTSVLRFWETEFPQLRPGKGGTGQRLFRRRDVETALRIRHLLYTDGYTIPGARQILRSRSTPTSPPPQTPPPAPAQSQLPLPVDTPAPNPSAQLRALQQNLRDLHALLSAAPTPLPRRRPAPSPEPHASLFHPDPADVH